MAMRGTASRAGRRPKASVWKHGGSRRSGRAGEPPECVGKPRRCPASPAAPLLPAPWPGGSPTRSLWVIINAPWYNYCVSPVKLDRQSSIGVATVIGEINNVNADVDLIRNSMEHEIKRPDTIFAGSMGMMTREYGGELKRTEDLEYNRLRRTGGVFEKQGIHFARVIVKFAFVSSVIRVGRNKAVHRCFLVCFQHATRPDGRAK